MEVEVRYSSLRTSHKVEVVKLETEENDKIVKLLEKFSQLIIYGLARGREKGFLLKKNMECYMYGR